MGKIYKVGYVIKNMEEETLDWSLYLAKEGYTQNFLRGIHPENKSISQEWKRELINAFKNEGSRKLAVRYLDGVIENILKFNLSEAENDLKEARKYKNISRDYPERYYNLVSAVYQICNTSAKVLGAKRLEKMLAVC